MTAERRLAKLERALSPLQAVLRWLDEAHNFGSLDEYLAASLEEPIAPSPLDGVIGSIEGGIRESLRGQPRQAVEDTLHNAARQVTVRYLLVLRLNAEASEEGRSMGLVAAALFFWMRALASDELTQAALTTSEGSAESSGWQAWRTAVLDLLRRFYAEEEARRILERDYLDARPALFPETEREWATTREHVERLARLALFLEHLADDAPPSLAEVALDPYRPEVASDAAERAAYLADLVRAHAWQLCGEDARAAGILRSRFRRAPEADAVATL